MTKPALISQTNKRGPHGHPTESWGGLNAHYSPSTSWIDGGEGRNGENLACFCWMLRTHTTGLLRQRREGQSWGDWDAITHMGWYRYSPRVFETEMSQLCATGAMRRATLERFILKAAGDVFLLSSDSADQPDRSGRDPRDECDDIKSIAGQSRFDYWEQISSEKKRHILSAMLCIDRISKCKSLTNRALSHNIQ